MTPANGRTVHEKDSAPRRDRRPYRDHRGQPRLAGRRPVARSTPSAPPGPSSGSFTWASVAGIGHLFSPGGVAQRFDQVTSAKAASQAAANGTRAQSIVGVGPGSPPRPPRPASATSCYILIVINIFFGIFNLFPMLPLDGGHVAIAVYEKIRTGRRKVLYHADVAKLMPFAWAVHAVPGLPHRAGLSYDILHPVANPFG